MLGTKEVGAIIFNQQQQHWTSIFLSIANDGVWSVTFLDPVVLIRPTTLQYARSKFEPLFIKWAEMVGRDKPVFQWSQEVSHPPFLSYHSSLTYYRLDSYSMIVAAVDL